MANSICVKTNVVGGLNIIAQAVLPFSGNISSLILSNSVDVDWELFFDKDINDLPRIASLSLSAQTSGGTLPASKFFYFRATTVDANGTEGAPCSIYSKKTGSGNTNQITCSWAAVAGAVAYRVYAGDHAGEEVLQTETASTSYILTTPPSSAPFGIPTSPDMVIITPAAAVTPIPISGILLGGRLLVSCTSGGNGQVAFSCLVG